MPSVESDRFLPEAAAVVVLVSLTTYIVTLSGFGAWLDAGEFVASAATLGVTHPPGHPLHSIWSGVFTILPVGTLAFRVSLASASAAALGSGALCVLVFRLLAMAQLAHLVRLGLSVVASLTVAFSSSLWTQATRPEVYALQYMLSMLVCERLVAALQPAGPSAQPQRTRALYVAAFLWGLSLCNHHFLALLLLPAAAVALGAFPFAVGLRSAALVVVGLLPYIYLPLRSAQSPVPNFGEPTTLGRWFWVVSAQAFHKNTGSGVPESLSKRALDVLVVYDQQFTLAGVLLVLATGLLMLRNRPWRRCVCTLALVVASSVLARIWLGHTSNNPDAEGYLVTGLAIASAYLALFFGLTIALLGALPRSPRLGAAVTLILLLALGGLCTLRLATNFTSQDRSGFTDTDSHDDVAFRRAPPESILILHDPETIFRALQYIVEFDVPESELLVVPTPFLSYPKMIESLVDSEPLLRSALTHYALDGQWDPSQLQSLASARTLLFEMDPFIPIEVIKTLIPSVLFHEVLSSEAYREDREAALSTHAQGHEHMQRLIGEQPENEKTRDRLLLHHYQDALYFAAVGQSDAAKESVARGLSLSPHARELRQLDRALETHEGPIDITPFLPPNPR